MADDRTYQIFVTGEERKALLDLLDVSTPTNYTPLGFAKLRIEQATEVTFPANENSE